jgi:hypothetical protein
VGDQSKLAAQRPAGVSGKARLSRESHTAAASSLAITNVHRRYRAVVITTGTPALVGALLSTLEMVWYAICGAEACELNT